MPLSPLSSMDTIMLAQRFPSHVILGTYYMEVSLVLVRLMAFGIHHLPHVEVMKHTIHFPLCIIIHSFQCFEMYFIETLKRLH